MVQKTVLENSDKVNGVIYFGSKERCMPCRALHPVMDILSKEYSNLNFIHIDVYDSPEVAQEHGVQSIPTIQLFINGDRKVSFVGLQSKSTYETAFREYNG